jgi:hypothetical protein
MIERTERRNPVLAEIRHLRLLNHPAIIRISDEGQDLCVEGARIFWH